MSTQSSDDRVEPVHAEVRLGERTGAVHGGASGMLYGLSDPGVPADALVAGARPRTIAQKAPAGLQHPTGDAIEVADAFFANGGEEVLVYMQDIYQQWPYEQLGMDDYLEKIRVMVTAVAAREDVDRFSWVPFNEPDWIWYGDWANDRDRFLADWEAAYTEIRRILPTARIVGMNDMVWSRERMEDFLPFALERGLLPDTIAWHELRPESLDTYRDHYREYRDLEAGLGIEPIAININEYGNRRDFSNPAQLVKWLAMFEDTKVDADMAFWTFAGNLSDHAVQSAQANGGWWLLAWYADLTGETVVATGDGVSLIAAVDEERAQATVLVEGIAASVSLDVSGLPSWFGTEVDVVLTRTSWTGYEGDAGVPAVVARARTVVSADRVVEVTMPGGDPMAAWRAVMTPAEADASGPRAPWVSTWEAESATIVGGTVTVRDDDPQKAATSGGRDVTRLTDDESEVTFSVEVPESGQYLLGVFYGTDSERAAHAVYVDGRFERVLSYPATLDETFRGRIDVPVALAAGGHELSLRTSGPDGRLSTAPVTLDRIDLTAFDGSDAIEVDARSARLSGGATIMPGSPEQPARARLTGDGAASFFLSARKDGYHDLALSLDARDGASAVILVGGRPIVGPFDVAGGDVRLVVRVHLAHGITEIVVSAASGRLDLVSVGLRRAAAADVASVILEAKDAVLGGSARVVESDGSATGAYIDGLSSGSVTFTSDQRWAPGAYNLAVWYGNAAKNRSHEYNTDVISAFATIVVEGAGVVSPALRHTYAEDNFWSRVIPLDIVSGGTRITVEGTAVSPTIDRLVLSPAALVPATGT